MSLTDTIHLTLRHFIIRHLLLIPQTYFAWPEFSIKNWEENEIYVLDSHKSRRERKFFLQNLDNREEKENENSIFFEREGASEVSISRDFSRFETLVNVMHPEGPGPARLSLTWVGLTAAAVCPRLLQCVQLVTSLTHPSLSPPSLLPSCPVRTQTDCLTSNHRPILCCLYSLPRIFVLRWHLRRLFLLRTQSVASHLDGAGVRVCIGHCLTFWTRSYVTLTSHVHPDECRV